MPVFCQTFITLGQDTNEFIDNVNYSVFRNHEIIFIGPTLPDKPTTIPVSDFDSIAFRKIDYYPTGSAKQALDTLVYMKKRLIGLDEVAVTSSKDRKNFLGESNRIVKKAARPISSDPIFGLLFRNEGTASLTAKKMTVNFRNVIYKTVYRVRFYQVKDSSAINGHQIINILREVFSTGDLYLDAGQNGKSDVLLDTAFVLELTDEILASVELVKYVSPPGETLTPDHDALTEIDFQLSDFAHQFFRKPRKSILLSPAWVLFVE